MADAAIIFGTKGLRAAALLPLVLVLLIRHS